MSLSDWASSGRVKIERANEHIRYFESEVAAYAKRRPYVATLQPKEDYDPRVNYMGQDFPITEREPVPLGWSAIAADAIHNLHVALDYLWQRATGGGSGRRKNYFPARQGPDAAKPLLKGQEAGRRNPAIDALLEVGAFEIGNPFWAIREFDDTDKHHTLTLVACYAGVFGVSPGPGARTVPPLSWVYLPRNFESRPPAAAFPPVLEDGAILYSHPYVADLNVDVQIVPAIAFGEGGLLKGKSVAETLENFSTAVDSLVSVFLEKGLIR